jgi:predicted RNase H-like nuclease (RuvC/YqgF family)
MKSDTDIVTRLRDIDCNRGDVHEAADEIERLRNERNAFEAERDELVRISNKLKHERDEARREACGTDGGTIGESMLEAKQRGWDCFKEMKP